MSNGIALLDTTDWSRLHHAYGRATDTPGHLRALLTNDDVARKAALDHLWSAILHQGTPWTATAPTALVLAALWTDERLDLGNEAGRESLMSFLAHVAMVFDQNRTTIDEVERLASRDIDALIAADDDEALYSDPEASEAFLARAVLACIRAAPGLAVAALQGLEHKEQSVRMTSVMACVALAKQNAVDRDTLTARLEGLSRSDASSDERACAILGLGDLDVSTAGFLDDRSPAVRLCAALAPTAATNDAATAILVDALTNAPAIDTWFANVPPQFPFRPKFSAIARLLERAKTFDAVAPAAISIARTAIKYTVDFDWGPMLAAAFPDGSGRVQSNLQRDFLRALVANDALWDPKFGNPGKWFKQAGLAYDRDACRAAAG
jgi:hypothetical protein